MFVLPLRKAAGMLKMFPLCVASFTLIKFVPDEVASPGKYALSETSAMTALE